MQPMTMRPAGTDPIAYAFTAVLAADEIARVRGLENAARRGTVLPMPAVQAAGTVDAQTAREAMRLAEAAAAAATGRRGGELQIRLEDDAT